MTDTITLYDDNTKVVAELAAPARHWHPARIVLYQGRAFLYSSGWIGHHSYREVSLYEA